MNENECEQLLLAAGRVLEKLKSMSDDEVLDKITELVEREEMERRWRGFVVSRATLAELKEDSEKIRAKVDKDMEKFNLGEL